MCEVPSTAATTVWSQSRQRWTGSDPDVVETSGGLHVVPCGFAIDGTGGCQDRGLTNAALTVLRDDSQDAAMVAEIEAGLQRIMVSNWFDEDDLRAEHCQIEATLDVLHYRGFHATRGLTRAPARLDR